MITHVETTTAPISDDAKTATIHARAQAERTPTRAAYRRYGLCRRSEARTAESRDFSVDLVGPTRPDVKWQAQQKKGFEAGQFHIDWQAEQVTCPEGHTSISWTPAIDNRKTEVIKITFSIRVLSKLSQPLFVYPLHALPTSHYHGAT